MEKIYNPHEVEQRWYQFWEDNDYFAPQGTGNPYCIMIPPPNVTGTLHMGHAFQDTLMDLLTRYHRMMGDNTLWQAGTDHAGIATQMVVERQLAKEGKTLSKINMKLPLAFETELKAKIDGCLLDLKAQGEEEFNKILKEQRDEIVDAFKESIPLPENVNPAEVQKFIQKYIKAFWQKYKKTEGASPDKIGKKLASEFKSYFVSMIDDDKAQKEYPQEINPTDKEIIVLNQIADMFLETKNKQGKDILLQIEFEAEYNTDKEMDRRVWRYESFVDFEQQKSHERNNTVPERELFTQVFYLRRSPKSGSQKPPIEHVDRTFTTPTSLVLKPIKYTAYHIYQFDIEQIIRLNVPFLFCFVGNMGKVVPETIWKYESEIRQMIYGDLTEAQRNVMRTVLANFKQKGYYDVDKYDNIDIIQQMIEITEMYRGNEEVVRAESLQQGFHQGEQINSIKLFLRGRLKFSALVEEIGEKKAQLVQQKSDELRQLLEKAIPLEKLLEQLEVKGVF